MKKSELRQIIREEIVKESAALEVSYFTNALQKLKKSGNLESVVDELAKNLGIEYNTRAVRRMKSMISGMLPDIKNSNRKELKKLSASILDSGVKFYW